jgi:hypothetical protein
MSINVFASIVVLNYNGKSFLHDCLAALRRQTYPTYEVIVVDNASMDGSAEYVSIHFPEVRLIRAERNLGFAAGNNLGIRAARGEFVALLNNDTQAHPEWLSELIKGMQSVPEVGMCASKMLFMHNPTYINSAGICLNVAGFAWDQWGGKLDDPHTQNSAEVFGACAGAALYRRAMLERLGGFDEDFFIYLEDVDLAWRARWLGWRCLYVPTARVLHFHSGTMGEGSPQKQYLLGRNKVWLLFKNVPLAAWWSLPVILAYDFMSVLYALVVRRNPHPLRGRLAGLASLGRMQMKRRTVQQQRLLSVREWLKSLSPLEAPWTIHQRFRYLATQVPPTIPQSIVPHESA